MTRRPDDPVKPAADLGAAIQLRALRDFVSMLAAGAPGSRLIEHAGGVAAAVVPAAPQRSIVNSVTYRESAALAESLGALGAAYAAAGVNAWTVWVPEYDHDAVASLNAAGHAFDGEPLAMLLDLSTAKPGPPGDLEWDANLDPQTLGAINDEAYGIDERGGIAAAFSRRPEGLDMRLYRALVDGQTACVLGTIDHDPVPGAAGPDCGVYFVAVPARFRRRRLASRLMGAVLAEARKRGCATSSLQASGMGEPVYRAMGYRPCFRLRLYERRASPG